MQRFANISMLSAFMYGYACCDLSTVMSNQRP